MSVPSSRPAPSAAGERRAPRSTTAVRVAAAFSTILALFAIALLVILPAMTELDRADRAVAEVDRAKHAGHDVAALVREQYIHQAHTIIEGNLSHIDHYKDIAKKTHDASVALGAFAASPQEARLGEQIVALVSMNHEDFLAVTLPAIERGDQDEVLRLHTETEKTVGRVAALVKELNGRLEARSEADRAAAERARRRVRLTLYACFSAATLVAGLIAIAMTRSIARRVGVLRSGVRRVGDGDLSHRIELGGSDELVELARGLDEMTRRLERHQQELVQSQKLASIGRLCAGVAHEINGPLGIILGYAKVIRRDGPDEEALRTIEDEVRQCQRIVQALLDTSRQETPRFEPVDLAQLARDAVDRLQTTGGLAGRSVVWRTPRTGVVAVGDEEKLRQVVLNLLTNAVEASPPGGVIAIEVGVDRNVAALSIVDDGPGLSPSANENLFEPFFTTKDRGTGLGLAISRAIVEAHRGKIIVEAAPGGGTRAEMRLRRASDAAEAFA